MDEMLGWSLVDLTNRLQERRLSPVELMESVL
ncbi:MAG: hypothetical protein RL698_2186, partial [Pseudomonadota bacterium]